MSKKAIIISLSAIAAIVIVPIVIVFSLPDISHFEDINKYNDLTVPMYGTNEKWFYKLQNFYILDSKNYDDQRNDLTKKICEKFLNLNNNLTEEESLKQAKTKLDNLTQNQIENYINFSFATYSKQIDQKYSLDKNDIPELGIHLITRNEISIDKLVYDTNSKKISFELNNAIYNNFGLYTTTDSKSKCELKNFCSIKYKIENYQLKESIWKIDNKFIPSFSIEKTDESKISIVTSTDGNFYNSNNVESRFKSDFVDLVKKYPKLKIFFNIDDNPNSNLDSFINNALKKSNQNFSILSKLKTNEKKFNIDIENNFDKETLDANKKPLWDGIFKYNFDLTMNFANIGFELSNDDKANIIINPKATIFRNPILFITNNNDIEIE